MTRTEELEYLEKRHRRDSIVRRILIVVAVIAALAAIGWSLVQSAANDRRIDQLRTSAEDSDTAAVSVAQEQQDQARTIADLCASGDVDQSTEAGKAVCLDATKDAAVDPEDKLETARGETGARGPVGPQGVPGEDGETGKPGEDGDDGSSGADGAPGDAGTDGEAGSDGAPGVDGESGADGEAGADGTSGAPGEAGPAGPQGETGPQGDAGPQGPAGETGPRGEPGAAGEDGRGLTDAQCDPDTGRWILTWTDDETSDGGPCLAPTDTPTDPPTEEVPQ